MIHVGHFFKYEFCFYAIACHVLPLCLEVRIIDILVGLAVEQGTWNIPSSSAVSVYSFDE